MPRGRALDQKTVLPGRSEAQQLLFKKLSTAVNFHINLEQCKRSIINIAPLPKKKKKPTLNVVTLSKELKMKGGCHFAGLLFLGESANSFPRELSIHPTLCFVLFFQALQQMQLHMLILVNLV